MSASTTQETVDKLSDIIRGLIGSGKTRLPSVKNLASDIGVSKTTICKALHVLHQQGVVTIRQGSGIHVPSSVTADDLKAHDTIEDHQEPRMTHSQRLTRRIGEDMLNGMYPPGTLLPSVKELTQRYGACFVTVKGALNALVKDSRLVPFKRGYRVFQFTAAAQQSHRPVMVCLSGSESVEYVIAGPRAVNMWRTLESELNRLGLDMEIFTISEAAGTHSRDAIRHRQFLSLQRDRSVIGYFVRLQKTGFEELSRLCTILSQTGKRTSLFDEFGEIIIPRTVITNKRFKMFTISIGTSAGKTVGEYLLGLGHRKVGCFSSFTNNADWTWHEDRIKGVVQAYESAGFANAVRTFVTDGFKRWMAYQDTRSGARPFSDIHKHFIRGAQSINPGIDPNDVSLYLMAVDWLWGFELDRMMKPLYDSAIHDRQITAWVAINDFVALSALKYLHANNVRVPQDISLIGFDDNIESLAAGLSSYNFNIPAAVTATLDHIMGGRMTRSQSIDKPVEIPGVIMERTTTRKKTREP
jgi:DNA-binding GntR family transcriptional regulator